MDFIQENISKCIKSVYHSEIGESFALVGWMVTFCPLKFKWAGQQLRLIAEVATGQDFQSIFGRKWSWICVSVPV